MQESASVEEKLEKSGNKAVQGIMDNKKMQNLEKLAPIELQQIKEELLRQRDMMSKKLASTTEINRRLEKEREIVFKMIQDEGKSLINRCNTLRQQGLTIKYQIGIKNKESKQLIDKVKKYEKSLK